MVVVKFRQRLTWTLMQREWSQDIILLPVQQVRFQRWAMANW